MIFVAVVFLWLIVMYVRDMRSLFVYRRTPFCTFSYKNVAPSFQYIQYVYVSDIRSLFVYGRLLLLLNIQ